MLHDRTNQQHFPVHYTTPDRYQNGTDTTRDNHLSYTVINPSPSHYSQSPPLTSSPRRSKTPQRQGSLPEVVRRPEPVSLQQLQSPITAPPVDDMEPQNISFIGSAEDDALRQGINRLNISSGTRTYRIPSPTRPSLSRNSFHQHHESESGESSETNEKGFYISFDNEQPKRPKPPLRAKRGSPKKDRTPSENPSPERKSSIDSSPWNDRLHQPAEEPFMVHRSSPMESTNRSNDVSSMRRETPNRERQQPRDSGEPAALIIGESNPDPVSCYYLKKITT